MESASTLLLAFDDEDESDGEDVTTMDTPGDGGGFTGKNHSFLVQFLRLIFETTLVYTDETHKPFRHAFEIAFPN